MSEVVENVSEQNSAQSKEAAAPPKEIVEDVTINNVDAAVKAVPEAESDTAAKNAESSGSKEATAKSSSPKVDSKKTPAKRTPSKRLTFVERAQKESEELVKTMGGNLEIEGGRRTRSSTRGTPTRPAVASTPPPTKKARASPASGASTPTRPRARGRKLDVADDVADEEETKPTSSKKKTTKSKKSAAKEVADDEEENQEKPDKANEAGEKPEGKKENLAADKRNEAPTTSEETKKPKDVVNQPEDKTDASLETVVEEAKSQLAADILPTEEKATKEPEIKGIPEVPESVKSDSSMDTDDIKFVTETKTTTAKIVVEAKEPSPEPMEIDSSSNTNDDIVEIHDDDVVVVQESTTDLTNKNFSELTNNIEKVEEKITGSSVARCANTAVPPADNVANANEVKPAAVADNDSNKTENDLCEPKIATSPPISAANDKSKATTPQTCN